jgi:organic hydroperoxide reductase OsmC/OhrA
LQRRIDKPSSSRPRASRRDKLAEAAEKGCPVSKLLNAEITLAKTLK